MNKYKLMLVAAVCGLSVASNAALSLAHYYSAYDVGGFTNDAVGTADGVLVSSTNTPWHGTPPNCFIDVDGSLATLNVGCAVDTNGVVQNGMVLGTNAVAGITGPFTISIWTTVWNNGDAGNTCGWSFCDPSITNTFTTDPAWRMNSPGRYVMGFPADGVASTFYAGKMEVVQTTATTSTVTTIHNDNASGWGLWLDDNMLHQWAMTYDGGTTIRYYLDGVLQDEDDTGVPIDLSQMTHATLAGGSPWANDVSMMANTYAFAIFDQALSSGEMLSYYNLGDAATVAQIEAVVPGFEINGQPTGNIFSNDVTVSATILDGAYTFESAILYVDDTAVQTNNTPSGTSNDISWAGIDLTLGSHTCRVDVVSVETSPNVTSTSKFTFNIVAFNDLYQYPEHGTNNWNSVTGTGKVTAVAVDGASEVTNMTLYIDGIDTAAVWTDLGTTGTISYSFSGLSHGAHTSTVVAAGTSSALWTNNITWWVILEAATPTNLVHHWDFEEGTGTTVNDLVGGVNGTVVGTNYEWKVGGLHITGEGYSDWWNAGNTNLGNAGAYVDLGSGFVSSLGSGAVTFEVTYWQNNSWYWGRLWDFGTSAGGAGVSTNSLSTPYFFCTTHNQGSGNAYVEVYDGVSAQHWMNNLLGPKAWDYDGTLVHLVYVYDPSAGGNNFAKLYINGELADIKVVPSYPLSNYSGSDQNCWLGRSQWPDQMLDSEYKDFRIYTGIMTADEVRARYILSVPFEATKVPTIQTLTVAGGMATLVWDSEADATYYVLTKSALTDPNWATNGSGVVSAGDTTTTTSVTASATTKFYTIEARP